MDSCHSCGTWFFDKKRFWPNTKMAGEAVVWRKHVLYMDGWFILVLRHHPRMYEVGRCDRNRSFNTWYSRRRVLVVCTIPDWRNITQLLQVINIARHVFCSKAAAETARKKEYSYIMQWFRVPELKCKNRWWCWWNHLAVVRRTCWNV